MADGNYELICIVLDSNFNTIRIIDQYDSFIWNERFNENGEFELQMEFDKDVLHDMSLDNYVTIKDSDVAMVIESVDLFTSVDGPTMRFSGRSIETVLSRRVVWKPEIFGPFVESSGGSDETVAIPINPKTKATWVPELVYNVITTLINDNAISPMKKDLYIVQVDDGHGGTKDSLAVRDIIYTERVLEGLSIDIGKFPQSVDTITAKYYGDNLYDVISDIAKSFNIGIKGEIIDGAIRITFYQPTDRTYMQDRRLPVVFSKEFENLINSTYRISTLDVVNSLLVVENSDESIPENATINSMINQYANKKINKRSSSLTYSGYKRRESSVKQEDQVNSDLTVAISKHNKTIFDGFTVDNESYIYGEDYYLGDIVQIENEYGITTEVRLMEMTRISDSNGYRENVVFKNMMDETNVYDIYDENIESIFDVTIEGFNYEDGCWHTRRGVGPSESTVALTAKCDMVLNFKVLCHDFWYAKANKSYENDVIDSLIIEKTDGTYRNTWQPGTNIFQTAKHDDHYEEVTDMYLQEGDTIRIRVSCVGIAQNNSSVTSRSSAELYAIKVTLYKDVIL